MCLGRNSRHGPPLGRSQEQSGGIQSIYVRRAIERVQLIDKQ